MVEHEAFSASGAWRAKAGGEAAGVLLKRVDARGKARELARDRVLMQHALAGGAMEFRLREAEGRLRRLLVAACDRHFDLLDKSPHPALAGAVDRRALFGLADALLCRFVIGHEHPFPHESGRLYRRAAAQVNSLGKRKRPTSGPRVAAACFALFFAAARPSREGGKASP